MSKRTQQRRALLTIALALALSTPLLTGCIGGEEANPELEPTSGDPQDEGAPGGPPPVLQEATAAWQTGLVPCAGQGQIQVNENSEGVSYDDVELDPATSQQPFNASLASSTDPVRWGIMFVSLEGATPMPAFETVETEGAVIEGTVPENAVVARFYSCAGLGHEAQFTVVQGSP